MSDKNLKGEEALKKLKDLVNDVKVSMMCTNREDGGIHSRPMATAGIDTDGTIWFFTNEASEKVDEIEHKNGLCLCYSKPSDNTYTCVMGMAQVVHDKTKEKELWNPLMKAWFPKGLDDPEMALVKVTPHHAEYWDDNDSRMVTFFKIAKAAISGGQYGSDNAHGNIDM